MVLPTPPPPPPLSIGLCTVTPKSSLQITLGRMAEWLWRVIYSPFSLPGFKLTSLGDSSFLEPQDCFICTNRWDFSWTRFRVGSNPTPFISFCARTSKHRGSLLRMCWGGGSATSWENRHRLFLCTTADATCLSVPFPVLIQNLFSAKTTKVKKPIYAKTGTRARDFPIRQLGAA